MSQNYIITKPKRMRNINPDAEESYQDADWLLKAERLQVRRWRKLKHQLA